MNDETTGDAGRPGWVDLSAPNMEAARAFYESLFGWTTREVDSGQDVPYLLFEQDGAPVAGGMQASQEMLDAGMSAIWTVSFLVDDVDRSVARALELGAQTPVPPFDTPVGRVALLVDPQGGHFSIVEAG